MSKQSSRRRSRPRPARRPPTVVRAMAPEDLLRHVPELAGAVPEDSLVLILFRRSQGTRPRTHGAMRVDLRHTEDPEELALWAGAVLQTVLRVDGVTGVAVAVYTPETFAPGGRPPAAAQIRAVAREAERRGLEVLDRFCVAADGWGSLDDPELPRGGRPLALIEPAEPLRRRLRAEPPVPLAPHRERVAFAAEYRLWWRCADGPGGVLHGVRLTEPGSAFGPAAEAEPAMERYRWGRDVVEVVDLVEAMLAPHGREASLARLTEAITGGRFRRPDLERIDAAIAALLDTARYVPEEERAPLDGMLAWLHWASGGGSAAGAYAQRALRAHPGRDVPTLVLVKLQRNELPDWAFRRDPAKADPVESLLAGERTAAG